VAEHAVIFDVDGVLLELTLDEEEIFFTALSRYVPTHNLSRDWNSYKIRNDEDIILEILERNQLAATLLPDVTSHYISLLTTSAVQSSAIAGAKALMQGLEGKARLGIATANLLKAARHRLQQVQLWEPVAANAHGAEGGGHKSIILSRALSELKLEPKHIVYIGDNLNDVTAGLTHGVHFIGFSESPDRRNQLREAGALHLSANHLETMVLIHRLLA
jgi:HAD superfamily hydrolase (TIGR01549 family)